MRFIGAGVALLLIACSEGPRAADAPTVADTVVARAPEVAPADSGTTRVTLSAEAMRTAGITLEAARAERAGSVAGWLTVPGQIEADPARVALISPRIAGRLERLDVVVGERVKAGESVGLLWSPAFQTAQSDYLLSARRARDLAGTADSTGATALALSAARRLTALGASAEDLARLDRGEPPASGLVLRAPFAGSLMEQGAVVGQAVEPGTMIFRLVDLSEVDVVADVPERALPQLRVGQRASVTLAAYPATRFEGVVERIRDELDPGTRTVDAILHVRNSRGQLRPGMFATVELGVVAGGTALPTGVSIPEAAVLMDGPGRIVFVATGERTFERREVQLQPIGSPEAPSQSERRILVTHGLDAGERVVVRGAFTLKSELGKAAFGEDE
jgi:RND family efflux transporter MFP subunit